MLEGEGLGAVGAQTLCSHFVGIAGPFPLLHVDPGSTSPESVSAFQEYLGLHITVQSRHVLNQKQIF